MPVILLGTEWRRVGDVRHAVAVVHPDFPLLPGDESKSACGMRIKLTRESWRQFPTPTPTTCSACMDVLTKLLTPWKPVLPPPKPYEGKSRGKRAQKASAA